MSGNLRAFLSELWDKVKRSWRSLSIMGILGAIALIVGLALDVPDFIERYFNNPPILDLTYTADGQVNVRDRITITYQATDTGYLSLWSIDPQQQVSQLLPLTNDASLILNKNLASKELDLKAGNNSGTHQLVLLWTPDTPEHLSRREYSQQADFEAELQALEARESVVKKRLDIPVYPKATQ
ncbi:MAG: hypothetical protein WAQ53_18370 [Thiofilum sp.]|uniref:hypothetical protein n=1 Tax=Thiofilum sp. TaxID=2212733 RepID=UPI0025D76A7F|nr:hypothetical protein [Thiofilum sp.]MBK8451938.1 hypothetical protein [Thiofilum sp.]